MKKALIPYHSIGDFRNLSLFVHMQVLIWDVYAQLDRHAVVWAIRSRPDLVCFLILVMNPHHFRMLPIIVLHARFCKEKLHNINKHNKVY